MSTTTYSSNDLFDFLDWATNRHVVKKNTADSWKTAAQKVLETLDASDHEDLRVLDVDSALQRFENHAGKNYKPESLRVYRSRFGIALEQFLKWKANPSAYKPENRSKALIAKSAQRVSTRASTKARDHDIVAMPAEREIAAEAWMLPIPLRPGVLVKIFGLPVDLNKAEARKICAVVTALASEGED